jgi:ABC-type dipeptide/oligopeptide/nickel transport system permease component
MVAETQYGRLVMSLTRTVPETVQQLWPRARITLGLLACALALGNALGLVLSVTALGPHAIFGAATAALSVVVLSLPSPTLSEAGRAFPLPPFLVAASVMSLMTASAVAIQERATLRRAVAHPSQTTRRAMGISRLVASIRGTKASSGPLAARLATDVPLVLTTAFVFEHALGLRGLGEVIVGALRSNDVDLLMLVVLFTTILVTMVQLLVDVLLGLLAARHVLARRRIGIFQ